MTRRRLFNRLALSSLPVLVALGLILYGIANPVQRRDLPSIGYGIHAFLWWNETTRPRDLELIRQLRFGWVKQIFGWLDIKPHADQPEDWTNADEVVAEAEYRGLKLVARLGKPPAWATRGGVGENQPPIDETAFGEFCGALAGRYKGRIAAYQVWNEPNLAREWLGQTPNAAAYVQLLAACNRAIKAADPAAVVITAGLAPTGTLSPEAWPDEMFLREMYKAGAHAHYDVLGVNAPGYKSPPETDPTTFGEHRWQAFRHVEDIRQIMLDHGQGHKQIAILEMGWTVDQRETIRDAAGNQIPNPYRWHAVTEAQQAAYLTSAYEYAAQHWRPWISLMITIYIPDPDWTEDNEEYWWSLITPGYNLTLREAYIALANTARYRDDEFQPAIDPGLNPYKPLPPRPKP